MRTIIAWVLIVLGVLMIILGCLEYFGVIKPAAAVSEPGVIELFLKIISEIQKQGAPWIAVAGLLVLAFGIWILPKGKKTT